MQMGQDVADIPVAAVQIHCRVGRNRHCNGHQGIKVLLRKFKQGFFIGRPGHG
jgi:hypothetical protein